MTAQQEIADERIVNVLLVDDSEDITDLMQAYLKDPRISLTVAGNGATESKLSRSVDSTWS